ncbi:MAG: GAF domain-containing protein [Candidatus Wallbacteria bacterium]|nr:GAF domain-containing protein [Candidatus Wallbacteria bacterium]
MLVVCPSCNKQCRVPDSHAPEELPCPSCRKPIRLAAPTAPPRLTWARPTGGEATFELRGTVTIGAADANSIPLADPGVAGFHACVRPADGGWLLEDLGTGATTLVNSIAVRTKRLVHLDWIQIGRTPMRFLDNPQLPVSLSELYGSEDRLAERDCRSLEPQAGVPASLKGLHQAAASLAAIEGELELLQELCRTAGSLFDADRSAVFCLYGAITEKPPLPLRLDASWLADAASGQSMAEFRVSSTLLRRVLDSDGPFLVKNLPEEPSMAGSGSVLESQTKSALACVLVCRGERLGVLYADRTRRQTPFSVEEQALFGALAVVGATALAGTRQTQRREQELLTRAQLARYLPASLVPEVAERRVAWEPGGQYRPITVLLASLRPAPAFAQLPPQETVKALNDCLWLIVGEIFKAEGTLDRFLVLAVTAVWGNPVKRSTDAVSAVTSALAIRRAVASFNRTRRAGGQPEIEVTVAVATGVAIACGLGVPSRMDYTVLGQPVNWVANAEAYLQMGQVLMDEQTYARVQGKVPVRPTATILPGEPHGHERTFEAVVEEPAARVRLTQPRRVTCHPSGGSRAVPAIVTEAGEGEVTLTIKPGELTEDRLELVFDAGQSPVAGRILERQTQRDYASRELEVLAVAFAPDSWQPLANWLRGD